VATPLDKKPDGAAEAPASGSRAADFGIDTTTKTTGEAIRDYVRGLRSGELGALPALLGLAVLLVLFTVLDSSGTFPGLLNLANLLQQGAGPTIIAMGLVFVLLTGEIDLAAGTASGLTAAVMALHLTSGGNLLGGMGTVVFAMFLVVVVVAIVLALVLRIWAGAAFSALALVLLLIGFPPNPWLQMLLAVSVGVVIGCLTGFLVAKLGMPSFVVTLALFIAWQGVILQLIGDGGTLGLRDPVLNAVANGNLSVLASWVLFVVAAGGYAAVLLVRQSSRRRLGLVAQPTGLVLLKVAAVVVLGAAATFLLTLNRSPGDVPISGVPYVVPIVLALLVAGTFVLDRTRFGRHVYAVGGNRERRPPRGHRRRAHPGLGVRHLRGARGDRRDRLLLEGGVGQPGGRWRQHAAVRRRRGRHRRHLAVRRARPGQQRRHRRPAPGHRPERAGPAAPAGGRRVRRDGAGAAARRRGGRARAPAVGRRATVTGMIAW
jgi:D-xylose transport system permease protein